MKTHAKNSLYAVGVLAAMTLAGNANAIMLGPFVDSKPFATTEIGGTLNLPQFGSAGAPAPAGAVLDSVTISGTADATNSGTLTNNAAQAQTFTISFTTDVTLTGPNSITLDPNPGTSQKFTGLAPATPVPYGPKTGSDTKTVPVPGADFGFYTGAGTFSLAYLSVSGESIIGGGGNINSAVATTADVSASVTYTYHINSTVPEPGSVALLAAGLMTGSGVFLRRRKK